MQKVPLTPICSSKYISLRSSRNNRYNTLICMALCLIWSSQVCAMGEDEDSYDKSKSSQIWLGKAAENKAEVADERKGGQKRKADSFADREQDPSDAVYDSEADCREHLSAQKHFFKRHSRSMRAQRLIRQFQREYTAYQALTPINLEGLSSRGRIILFRTISEIVREKMGDERYFEEEEYASVSKVDIPFRFGKLSFALRYKPTFNQWNRSSQPGNFWSDALSKYKDIHPTLARLPEKRKRRYAQDLYTNRTRKKASGNLEIDRDTMLLELEIARRLSNATDIHPIPVASAISRWVEASATGEADISHLFDPLGSLHPFSGWKTSDRKRAVKNILRSTQQRAATRSEILSEFQDFYGGSSEDDS